MDQIIHNVLCFDRFALDLTRGSLRASGRDIDLPPKAFELLKYLVGNAGRLVPKDELCRAVWPNVFVSDDSLVQCVRELRERLSDESHSLIRTVPRRGYMLDADVRAEASLAVELSDAAPPAGAPRLAGARAAVAIVACLAVLLAGLGGWMLTRPRQASTPAAATIGTPPRLSVAVLPFENLGDGSGDQRFADGVADDLTAGLARAFGGQIAARSATMEYKGAPVDPQRAGRALNVRYLVEGAISRAGDQMRVTARLVDASSRATIWTETFASAQQDAAALRDEISWRLSRRFTLEIYRAASARSIRERPDAPDALDFMIRARALQHAAPRGRDLTEARRLYREAARLDPEMAGAWIGVAYTYLRNVRFSATRAQDLAEAEAAADRAVALRPHLSSTYTVKGWVRYEQQRMDDAFLAFEHALYIDPNDVEGLASFAAAQIMLGRPHEALEPLRKAMRLSPVDFDMPRWRLFLGVAYLHLRRDDEAIEWLKKTAALIPADPFVHLFLASALALSGQDAAAQAAIAEVLKLLPGYTLARFKAVEPSSAPAFLADRLRVYEGLLKAGLPER